MLTLACVRHLSQLLCSLFLILSRRVAGAKVCSLRHNNGDKDYLKTCG